MRTLSLALLLMSLARIAGAQTPDPTRPPEMAGATPAASSAHAKSVEAPAPMKVQSVQLPREGRASALVDGKLMFVGDKLGATTVSAIDAQGIQLRNAKGAIERLPLLDAQVVKQPVFAAADGLAPVASLLAKGK